MILKKLSSSLFLLLKGFIDTSVRSHRRLARLFNIPRRRGVERKFWTQFLNSNKNFLLPYQPSLIFVRSTPRLLNNIIFLYPMCIYASIRKQGEALSLKFGRDIPPLPLPTPSSHFVVTRPRKMLQPEKKGRGRGRRRQCDCTSNASNDFYISLVYKTWRGRPLKITLSLGTIIHSPKREEKEVGILQMNPLRKK